ncbi:MAG TPA: WG repeat-containing protein [Candidatus Angelobacter sp.]
MLQLRPNSMPGWLTVVACICALVLTASLAPAQTVGATGGLYPFRSPVNAKIGYIDAQGAIKIAPQFEDCGQVNEGAWLSDGRIRTGCAQVGYADASGRLVIKPRFDEAQPFSHSLAAVKDHKGVWGYIDRDGKSVIAPRFPDAGDFSEGLAPVSNDDGLWGYIDSMGRVKIPFKFQHAGSFSGGLASVGVNDKYGYINNAGSLVIPAQFKQAAPFSEGLAAVQNGLWHYIGSDGKVAFAGDFEQAGKFSEGIAPVKLKNGVGFGYINYSGEFALPPQFEHAYPFRGGLALVHFKTECDSVDVEKCKLQYGYITKTGQRIFSAALPYVRKGGSRSGAGNLLHQELPMTSVNIETVPSGAKVYLVPLDDWESDKNLANEKEKMLKYLQNEYTPLRNYEVIEQVYLVLLELKGATIERQFDVNGHGSKFLAVDFDKEKQ